MKAEPGKIKIYGRNSVQIIGNSSSTTPVNEDVSDITYEDFDVTATHPFSALSSFRIMKSYELKEIKDLHLDNVHYIGGSNPRIDYAVLTSVPAFIAMALMIIFSETYNQNCYRIRRLLERIKCHFLLKTIKRRFLIC